MWENFKELHQRIISIVGEDVESSQTLVELKIYQDIILAIIYQRYDLPPKNLKKKNKDCIRFELLFAPLSASISKHDNDNDQCVKVLDTNNIEFKMGHLSYSFEIQNLTFHNFQTHSFSDVVDNNFGNVLVS